MQTIISVLESNELGHFKCIRQVATIIDPQMLIDEGLDSNLAHEFINLMAETVNRLDIRKVPSPRLELCLSFKSGPQQGLTVPIKSQCNIMFGCSADIDEPFQADGRTYGRYVHLDGLSPQAFETFYDARRVALFIRNLAHLDDIQSCVFMRLAPKQTLTLEPDDAFRIGQLEFQVQRFNTSVAQDMGQRDHMEDC